MKCFFFTLHVRTCRINKLPDYFQVYMKISIFFYEVSNFCTHCLLQNNLQQTAFLTFNVYFYMFCFVCRQCFKRGRLLVNLNLLEQSSQVIQSKTDGRCSLLCDRFKAEHGHDTRQNTHHGTTTMTFQITDHISNTVVFTFQVGL